MAERALRGSRLGAQSYETDNGVEMAPRQSVTYACPREHRFSVPFSLEADVPEVWECTVCGAEALRLDGTRPEPKKGKPARTHWDMLLARSVRSRGAAGRAAGLLRPVPRVRQQPAQER
jgi:hypothetical protein